MAAPAMARHPWLRYALKRLSILMSKSRKTNRDHGKKTQRPMVEDEVVAEQLEALLTPAIISQEAYYRQMGLRDRILNLPLMVAAVLAREVGVEPIVTPRPSLSEPDVRLSPHPATGKQGLVTTRITKNHFCCPSSHAISLLSWLVSGAARLPFPSLFYQLS